MIRKKKVSINRKTRILLARCHEKLFDVCPDFQQKISKDIINENQAITVETLSVYNVLKKQKTGKIYICILEQFYRQT